MTRHDEKFPSVLDQMSTAEQDITVPSNTTRASISMSTHPPSEQPTISRLTSNVTRKLSSQMPHALPPRYEITLFRRRYFRAVCVLWVLNVSLESMTITRYFASFDAATVS